LPIGCQNPPAGEQCEGLLERASDELLERLEAALPHVDDLLVDAHGQRRVGVADEIHRPPWRQVELGQDEANVRRSVCGVHRAISRWSRAASSSLARSTDASTIVRRTLSTLLRRPLRVANRVVSAVAELGLVVDQQVVQGRRAARPSGPRGGRRR
jgi:hypothetical protein